MSHSTKKQQHEQARKKHKQEGQTHARELANKKPSTTAAWVLGIGITLLIFAVVAVLVT